MNVISSLDKMHIIWVVMYGVCKLYAIKVAIEQPTSQNMSGQRTFLNFLLAHSLFAGGECNIVIVLRRADPRSMITPLSLSARNVYNDGMQT